MASTIIVGASLGGLRVAEALRRSDYTGTIDVLGDERHLPYDRPPLSKDVLTGAQDPGKTFFRSPDQLIDQDIAVHVNTAATALDLASKTIVTDDQSWPYDHLVIATGARARRLPGTDGLGGIHTIRTLDDSRRIREALESASSVVVVGAGFIGAEAAASARHLGCEVTVVEALPAPLVRAVGEDVGAACSGLHAEYGTELACGVGVKGLEGDDHVRAVLLDDGHRIEADLVIVGIGVIPNTEWLEGSGIDVSNGVVCNEFLMPGPDGVYALGDVANWFNPRYGETMRIEHWTTAVEQAQIVAHNIVHADDQRQCDVIPYFWSDQYGHRIQFAGRSNADLVAEPHVTAEVARYLALYRRGDELIGALAIDGTVALMHLRARMMAGTNDWAASLDFVGSL